MIEIKSETFEIEEKEDAEETNREDNGKEEEEEKEEMNNNDIGENIEVKEEDERDGVEDDDDGGEGGGGMSPMETATLLLLSRIAMFNKVSFVNSFHSEDTLERIHHATNHFIFVLPQFQM